MTDNDEGFDDWLRREAGHETAPADPEPADVTSPGYTPTNPSFGGRVGGYVDMTPRPSPESSFQTLLRDEVDAVRYGRGRW